MATLNDAVIEHILNETTVGLNQIACTIRHGGYSYLCSKTVFVRRPDKHATEFEERPAPGFRKVVWSLADKRQMFETIVNAFSSPGVDMPEGMNAFYSDGSILAMFRAPDVWDGEINEDDACCVPLQSAETEAHAYLLPLYARGCRVRLTPVGKSIFAVISSGDEQAVAACKVFTRPVKFNKTAKEAEMSKLKLINPVKQKVEQVPLPVPQPVEQDLTPAEPVESEVVEVLEPETATDANGAPFDVDAKADVTESVPSVSGAGSVAAPVAAKPAARPVQRVGFDFGPVIEYLKGGFDLKDSEARSKFQHEKVDLRDIITYAARRLANGVMAYESVVVERDRALAKAQAPAKIDPGMIATVLAELQKKQQQQK